MSATVSQITSLTFAYSTVYSGANQEKHQSSASLVFVRGIHRWPVNSPYKEPVMRKMLPFDDVIRHWREVRFDWFIELYFLRLQGALSQYKHKSSTVTNIIMDLCALNFIHNNWAMALDTHCRSYSYILPYHINLGVICYLQHFATVLLSKESFITVEESTLLHRSHSRVVKMKSVGMMTSSNGNIFRVTGPLCGEFTGPGEFPTQRPVTRSFDVFFDLRPNKRLSKQWRGWWFETLSRPFWRHRNGSLRLGLYIDHTYMDLYPIMGAINCSMYALSN